MGSLQIRKLPDDVYRALAERAEQDGRSLAQQAIAELRQLPLLQARDRRRRLLEHVRVRPPRNTDLFDPVDLIREDRDACSTSCSTRQPPCSSCSDPTTLST